MSEDNIAKQEPVNEQASQKIRLLDSGRSTTMPLHYPAEVDGRVIDRIVIRRMTTGQVAAFIDELQAANGAVQMIRFPMFYDVDGNQLPNALFDELDDDDTTRLTEVAADFLPSRFRVNQEVDTAPVTGGPTEPS